MTLVKASMRHGVPSATGRRRQPRQSGADLQDVAGKTRLNDITDIDVLMLRNDPSNDAIDRPWAQDVGIQFGRRAAQRGVMVLNDPSALSQASNKLYFQSFPREVRAKTLIIRFPATSRTSPRSTAARRHGGKVVLKPLQGSGGQGVFLVNAKSTANLNQMIDAISRDGYIIAQAYVPEAEKGDIRLFLMHGVPLAVDGKYAAMRRVSSKNDIRSNIHAGGKAVAVKISERELRVAELIRRKLMHHSCTQWRCSSNDQGASGGRHPAARRQPLRQLPRMPAPAHAPPAR